jgi:hypothetical protein
MKLSKANTVYFQLMFKTATVRPVTLEQTVITPNTAQPPNYTEQKS